MKLEMCGKVAMEFIVLFCVSFVRDSTIFTSIPNAEWVGLRIMTGGQNEDIEL